MPPRKGATALNISLPDHLASQLAVLAAAPEHHHSKSQVLEMALRSYLEGGANLTALDTVHHQLSTLETNLGQQIQVLDQTLQTLTGLVQTLLTRVTALEERFTAFAADQDRRYEDLQGAYDRLKASQAAPERGGSWRGFRTR